LRKRKRLIDNSKGKYFHNDFNVMNSNKIVVDIALIPSEPIVKLAVELNRSRSFPDTVKEDYVLDAKTCIPHITLLMGLISRDQLVEVTIKLSSIVEKFSALNLRATGFTSSPHPDGKIFSTLVIEKSPDIQKLHETILEELKPFFSWDGVGKEMFYSPPPVRGISSFWVKGFGKNSVRENYEPHISLGFAELKQELVPVQFIASKLALCHLGNYCTCRDVLWFIELK